MSVAMPMTIDRRMPGRPRLAPALTLLLGSLLLGVTGCARSVTTHGLPTVMEAPPAPKSPEALKNLPAAALEKRGFNYLKSGNLGLAELHLLAALQKAPHTAALYAGLGDTYRLEKNWAQAGRAYQAALAKAPDNLQALIGIGKLYRQQGQADHALAYLLRARQAAPENPEVLTELAITCDATGDDATGERLFLKVVAMEPESAAAHNNLGFHYLLTGHYDQAVTAFRRAAAIAPASKLIQCNLATATALDGNEVTALNLFKQNLGPAAAYNNVGYLLMVQGEDRKAAAALQRALDTDPRFYPRAKNNLDRLQQSMTSPAP